MLTVVIIRVTRTFEFIGYVGWTLDWWFHLVWHLLLLLVVLVDVVEALSIFITLFLCLKRFLLRGRLAFTIVFLFRCCLIARQIFKVQGRYNRRSLSSLCRIRVMDDQRIAVIAVKAVLIIFFSLRLRNFTVIWGYLAHDFIKTICPDCFDPFRLVQFIYWDTFILKSKEEKEHLVDFLLVPMRLFLGFSELKSLLFNFYHEVYLSWRYLGLIGWDWAVI